MNNNYYKFLKLILKKNTLLRVLQIYECFNIRLKGISLEFGAINNKDKTFSNFIKGKSKFHYSNKISNKKLKVFYSDLTKKLNLDSDWTEHHENDLWTYNLHYFDGLIRENSNFDRNLYLIHSWIQKNHVNASKGWDSYPTSLRLVNWIKWMIENEYQEDPLILESIIKQGQWLSKKKVDFLLFHEIL